MEKGIMKIVWPKLIGIFLFILFLALINFLVQYITFNSFVSFTNFFNRNSILIVGIVVLFLFSEIISGTKFPVNILGPILNFSAAWLLLVFIFSFLKALNRRFDIYVLELVMLLETPIFITILSLTFIFGYLPIIYKIIKEKNPESEITESKKPVEKIKIIERIVEKEKPKKRKKRKKKN